MFGGDFVPSCGDCDVDNDNLGACFDNDSDGDGCPDALEGDGGILRSQVDAKGMITGGVDANGIPLLIGASGQGVGSSLDPTVQNTECICQEPTYSIDNLATGICDGDTAKIKLRLAGVAPFNVYYTSSLSGTQSVMNLNADSLEFKVYQTETIQIDSVSDAVCSTSITNSVSITVTTLPTISGTGDERCGTGNIDLTASTSAGTINWYNDLLGGVSQGTGTTFNIPSLANTTTYYAQSFANGCGSQRISIDATIHPIPFVELGNDTTLCQGNKLTLDAKYSTPTYSVLWDNGVNTIANLQTIDVSTTSTHTVEVSTQYCSDKDTIMITVQDNPVVNFGLDTTLCEGQSMTLDASNFNVTYKWNTGDIDRLLEVSSTGLYAVLVTNEYNCIAFDSITITVSNLPSIDLGNDTTICKGSELMLDVGTSLYDIIWNTNEVSQRIYVSYNDTYFVRVSSSEYCFDEDTITISTQAPPIVNLGEDFEINEGETYTIIAGNDNATYIWNTNETTQSIDISKEDLYSVTVIDSIGCTGYDEIYISVLERLIIPNAFSPNGDGINDKWEIEGINERPVASVLVFNRWGAKVSENYGSYKPWDGTNNGHSLPIGTYYHIITLDDEVKQTFTGAITITR